jgi:hypothetical protein
MAATAIYLIGQFDAVLLPFSAILSSVSRKIRCFAISAQPC